MQFESVEIFEKKPDDFTSELMATGCFVNSQGRILLLQQSLQKADAGAWGIPGGKVEPSETVLEGIVRELKEETSIVVEDPSLLHHFATLYVRKPSVDFAFCLFILQMSSDPEVVLSLEHEAYRWCLLDEIKDIPMRVGGHLVLQKYRDFKSKSLEDPF